MFDYLVSLIPPDRSKKARFYRLRNGELTIHTDVSEAMSGTKAVLTFDLDNLLRFTVTRGARIECPTLDITQMARLSTGLPRKEVEKAGEKPWSIWELLSQAYQDRLDVLRLISNMHYGIDRTLNLIETDEMFGEFLREIRLVGTNLIVSLKEQGEWERFEKVELPIQQVCNRRTLDGLNYQKTGLNSKIAGLNKLCNRSRNRLQLEYGVISGRDYGRLRKAVRNSAVPSLEGFVGKAEFDYLMKENRSKDALFELLHEERKSTRDVRTLLRFAPEDTVIHPSFETMGTVTGRILVTEPQIQNLSRKFRSVIQAAPNKVLVYVDYAQFEACILADDSEDQALINDVNTGDLYSVMSRRIFGHDNERDFCKTLFYRFSYGSSNSDLEPLVSAQGGRLTVSGKSVFSAYERLEEYRTEIGVQLHQEQKIGSRLGNYRYYRPEAEHTVETPRWGISQRIQGTASLILKRAILRAVEDADIEFLIPMHDAAVFQVPITTRREKADRLIAIFEETLKIECPSINPRAVIKSFSD